MRLDTQQAARILSWKAFFWNPGEIGTGGTVWRSNWTLYGKAMSKRKQTAAGSQVRMRVRDWNSMPVMRQPSPPSRT